MDKKNMLKVMSECRQILEGESMEAINKWFNEKGITTYKLRNDKTRDVITISNYILQKMLLDKPSNKAGRKNEILIHNDPSQFLRRLIEYYRQANKCYEFCRLIKHFSQWDYEFDFFFQIANGKNEQLIGIYLAVHTAIKNSKFSHSKEILSGALAQIEDWAQMTKSIFKHAQEQELYQDYSTVVQDHYMSIKKNPNQKMNGAQFFKICEHISGLQKDRQKMKQQFREETQVMKEFKQQEHVMRGFTGEMLLNGLTLEDRELIRVLSCKDKNIARLLQQKQDKVICMIGEQVEQLRRRIDQQKQRYIEQLKYEKELIDNQDKINKAILHHILHRSVESESDVLKKILHFNQKYQLPTKEIQESMQVINHRRLIEIIEEEQLQLD